MTLRIMQYGESILHKKGTSVDAFDKELSKLAEDMLLSLIHI